MPQSIRILGIDPGSNIAGFACIENLRVNPVQPKDFKICGAGAIHFDRKSPHSKRISQLHETTLKLIEEFQPEFCVIEKAFCGVNANSALKLGEARGALIAAVLKMNIKFMELTPREAKKNVTGNGGATKEEVAHSLKLLMGFQLGKLPYDVADALALALSFGLRLPTYSSLIIMPTIERSL